MAAPTVEEICARIAVVLEVPAGRVHSDAALADLVSESFRLVEMAIDLQEDYDVIFTQADLRELTTVGHLARLIRSRVP